MQQPDGPSAEIDLSRPSAARVYDYFLGGAHNFEIDRQLAEQVAGRTPNLAATMRAGREFLRRAVRVLLAGVVHMPLWRPDSPADVDAPPERFGAFGGVGRPDGTVG